MANNVFPSPHPLVAHKLALLRNVETKPKKFRELVRELAILLCYEATTDLETEEIEVTTPMGQAKGRELKKGIGLVPVLRAGLGMVEGIWEMVPGAEVWHIGLKRDERTLQPMQYYANKPVQPRVQLCLVLDPM
ncbi:MAG: uracil phosphoribosyltransferase, partial [Anaerolineales bacterium]